MKKLLICFFTLCTIGRLNAQDITGSWMGLVPTAAINLHLVFNIKKIADTSYSATFDSPDQNVFGIACSKVYKVKDSVFIEIAMINGGYKGLLDNNNGISGVYRQGGGKLPINLKHITDIEKAALSANKARPQTPKAPFNYYSEDVEYDNTDKSLHYGATFTRPSGDGKYPTVIIISGSGTQDRDGTLFGHKLYWVLADYLTKNGIAVLRVDDRGAGKSSLGPDIDKKTSLDFSYDVETSLNYLETRADVDKKHLGLIGHSEGGMIAPMVAARRKDVSFIVLWGAPGVGGAEVLAGQYALALKKHGVDSTAADAFKHLHLHVLNLFSSSPTSEVLNQKIEPVFDAWKKVQTQKTLDALNIHDGALTGVFKTYDAIYDKAWLRYFITYNPANDLSKVTCSVLAINGAKDTQVLASENLPVIKAILTKNGNKDVKTIAIPNLNHLLQTATTGDEPEYETIDETMSPAALNIISGWIKLHTK